MNYFYKEIHNFFLENQNQIKAAKEKQYLYSPFKHFGIYVVQRKDFYKDLIQEIKAWNKKEVLDAINFYWNKEYYEEKVFALNILNLHIDKIKLSDQRLIEKLISESCGWALLDNFVYNVYEVWFAESQTKSEKILKEWIKNKDFWFRRSALLAQILLFRKKKGNKNLFFELAKSQFDESWIDKEYEKYRFDKQHYLHPTRARFFIRKAIGWACREIAQKEPETLKKFLKENKNKMSGLSYREASRKL